LSTAQWLTLVVFAIVVAAMVVLPGGIKTDYLDGGLNPNLFGGHRLSNLRVHGEESPVSTVNGKSAVLLLSPQRGSRKAIAIWFRSRDVW
jgi:hypothetical protein